MGARIGIRFIGQSDGFEDFHRAAFVLGHAVKPRLKFQNFAGAKKRIEIYFLRYDANRRPCPAELFLGVEIPDPRTAGGFDR